MALKLSNAAAILAAEAVAGRINVGAAASTLVIYAGVAPADTDTAIGAQPVLVSFELPDPAFGAGADTNPGGTCTLNPVDPVQALATGTATFFRIIDGDGVAVTQGVVTDTTGNGDLKLSSTSVISGIDVTVVSGTITMPEG